MSIDLLGLTVELPSKLGQGWVSFILLIVSILACILACEISGDSYQRKTWRLIIGRFMLYPSILLIILTFIWWVSIAGPYMNSHVESQEPEKPISIMSVVTESKIDTIRVPVHDTVYVHKKGWGW